jgi:hypothetical protein
LFNRKKIYIKISIFWLLIKKILPIFLIKKIKKIVKPIIVNLLLPKDPNFNPINRNLFKHHNFKKYNSKLEEKNEILMVTAFTSDRIDLLEDIILESFESNVQVSWLIVGSSQKDMQFIEKMTSKHPNKVSGFLEKNNPLGKKWQSLIFASEEVEFDLLGITGSDDLIFKETYNQIIKRFKSLNNNSKENDSIGLFCFNDWYVIGEKELFNAQYYNNSFQPVGAGRFFTKKFLKNIDYELFDVEINKLLDDKGYYQIERNGYYYDLLNTKEDCGFISIKLGSELNSYKNIKNSENILVTEVSNTVIKKNMSIRNFEKYVDEITRDKLVKEHVSKKNKFYLTEFFY